MTPDEIITVIENGKYGFARIGYTQPLPQEGEMADWAYEEVIQAIQHDLVPSDLQNQYYANITRGDFATIVVQLLEVVSGDSIEDIVLEDTGKTLEELALAYPFSDTNSWDVVAANALGVMNGTSETTFSPFDTYTRQQAYMTIWHLYNVMVTE